MLRIALLAAVMAVLTSCGDPWNDPYPRGAERENVLYAAFNERPKHLDPVQSYSSNEITFTAQIYTPPLQYHFLKRPHTLIPFAAESIPAARALDRDGQPLAEGAPAEEVAYTEYEIRLRPGMGYQPHPAFAANADGSPRYLGLTESDLEGVHALRDFGQTGTREVTAEDFAYQIKRLAHPRLHSPIFGLMADYIVGLKELAQALQAAQRGLAESGRADAWLDLRAFPLEGVTVVDRHTLRIRLRGSYPQFVYWLAMPFFAPVPFEADRFYAQSALAPRNISLDTYPVGAGPYMLSENNPNRRMVLERNPNYFGERYPSEGSPEDEAAGLLADAGKPLPFIDKVVFTLEKENIPYWNKFLQGYFDASGISSDAFDQAVRTSGSGDVSLTEEMAAKGISLRTAVAPSTFYMGFNMLDGVVGGPGDRTRKLRQAIAVAVDYEEFIAIFQNGRGVAAQGPLPPGIFGYRDGREGMNTLVYDWVDGAARRKPVEVARRLLAEAGYPNGVDEKTGAPLVLYLDATARGPDDKARLDWLRKQFAKLDIDLVVRATDYNRFQEKIRKGNAQIFYWGWNADYPDPENFLFLLHGPQGKVKAQGENAANYENAEFDRLFEQMKNMPNGEARQAIIDRMTAIVQTDVPWLWGMHPKEYSLAHGWLFNRKPNQIANNLLKYQRVDADLRARRRAEWNRPAWWPIAGVVLFVVALIYPAVVLFRRRESGTARWDLRGG